MALASRENTQRKYHGKSVKRKRQREGLCRRPCCSMQTAQPQPPPRPRIPGGSPCRAVLRNQQANLRFASAPAGPGHGNAVTIASARASSMYPTRTSRAMPGAGYDDDVRLPHPPYGCHDVRPRVGRLPPEPGRRATTSSEFTARNNNKQRSRWRGAFMAGQIMPGVAREHHPVGEDVHEGGTRLRRKRANSARGTRDAAQRKIGGVTPARRRAWITR